MVQSHIPEDWNSQRRQCETLKSCIKAYSKCSHMVSSVMDLKMQSYRSIFIYLNRVGTMTSIVISTDMQGLCYTL